MPLTISEFFDRLRESEILGADQVEAMLRKIPEPKRGLDAARVIEKLIEAKKLTSYQAMALAEGRGQTLAIGEYVVLHELGAGGMGQVYKARHRRLKRTVALKVLPPAVSQNASAVKRFEREVEAAAKLVHANIVTTHDAGAQKGIHFLVMECVEGDDLARLVKKYGPLPIEAAISYVEQTARGLAYAHQQGVIHRDIKPANLLLSPEGAVKILDMGLARFDEAVQAGGEEGLTQTGSMMGTPDYMAPEQALDTKHADARADIYSLGCTLFFLLTSRRMYDGDTVMTRLVAHREQPIPSLAAARDGLPPELPAIFERMVAKHPDDRFQSMEEVCAALVSCQTEDSGGRTAAYANTVRSDAIAKGDSHSVPIPTLVTATSQSAISRFAKRENRSMRRRWIAGGCAALAGLVLVAAIAIGGRGFLAKQGSKHGEKKTGAPLSLPASPVDAASQPRDSFESSLQMKLVYISPGEFDMGSPESEVGGKDEKLHRVRITQGFYIGAHEVTVGRFREFVQQAKYQTDAETDGQGGWGWNYDRRGTFKRKPEYNWRNAGFIQSKDHPVVNVSWNDAKAFCEWLSTQDKRTFRLPTEAEWEYACRAGTKTTYFGGDDPETLVRYGNVADGTAKANFPQWTNAIMARDGYVFTAPVGNFQPNAFGLYDMYGNVGEWCGDWYADYAGDAADPQGPASGVRRVIRGGDYFVSVSDCRSARRSHEWPTLGHTGIGFRVVCEQGTRPMPTPGAAPASSGGAFAWSKLISPTTIEDEVKAIKLEVDKDISTPADFAGKGYKAARRHFTMLAVMLSIAGEYDGDVRWKKDAPSARDRMASTAVKSKVGTEQVYKEAELRKGELKDLVGGSGLAGKEAEAEAKADWKTVCNRSPVMQRLEIAHQGKLQPRTANKAEFAGNKNQVLHEAQIIAALAEVLQKDGMEDADDNEYKNFGIQLKTAALEIVDAVKMNDYDKARAAVGNVGQACSQCHERFRG